MVSSFDPHNMCEKVERITAKTGCTSCTNWTISFKVQGFQTKTHLLQRHFIFLSLFQLKTFFASNMQHSKPHTEIPTLSDFILLFFMHLMIYFQLNDLEIGKGYNLNSEKFETWHGIIICPHNMCAKVERITAKTGCTSCTNWTISFKVQGFHTKTHLLQRHFI